MAQIQHTPASQASFEKYGRKSKRELSLVQMNRVVPWSELLALIEPQFRILKRVFRFTKVRYRGIWKHHQGRCAALAPVNLYMHRNRPGPQGA